MSLVKMPFLKKQKSRLYKNKFNPNKPRFLFGVRPGVKDIWRTELGAGLALGSSSCNAVNGFRFFAAKESYIN